MALLALGPFSIGLAACASRGDEAPAETAAPDAAPVATDVAIVGLPDDEAEAARSRVADLLASFERSGGRASYVDDAAYEIEAYLRSRGFADAGASYDVATDGTARIDVDAGARSTIGEVTATWDPGCPLEEDELVRYVNGPRTGLFGRGDMLYVEGRVARAAETVIGDLVALGHLDATAQITDPGPRPEGGSVDIRLDVTAGPVYRVGDVTVAFDGDAEIDAELRAFVEKEVRALLASDEGDDRGATRSYEPRLGGRLRSAVRDAFAQRGHPDAAVDVTSAIDDASKRANLSVVATPGPRVVVSQIRFVGDIKTRESFLRKRLRLEPGEAYDSQGVRAGVRRLYRSGLFSEIRPRLEGDGPSRDLVIEVVERPSLEFYFEPGYGSYELFRGTVGAQDRNLFDMGVNGLAEVTVAVRALRSRIRLTDPYFLNERFIGDIELEYQRRDEPSFVRETANIGAFATKEWSESTATTLGYRFGFSDAKDVEVVDEDVEEAQEAVNLASIFASQWYDTRDALLAPSGGTSADLSVEFALAPLGSELNFIRGKLSTAHFTALTSDDVLALGLRFGVIVPIAGDDLIPIQERFFAGGENSVRSFRESELGPVDADGEPIGGEAFSTASIEWRHEIGAAFQSALFVDAGFVEQQAQDVFDFDDVRYGIGAGIRYLLPIGPLRVDAAVNPDPDEFEDDWVVHFSFGMPF